ncbi:MAG TPA: maleylacetoacetate isomerase [Burkholderiaceae bacterium]|nr:maleylacetoacetate isomerase [Burkholderiaceae bacterium]
MQLYNYFRSSASYRVRIALALKGLDAELLPIHLVKREQASDAYRAIAPSQLVPSLRVGDALLTQSLAIIEYLDEVHPEPPLLPGDALARARIRSLAQDVACEIHPLNNLRVLRYLVHDLKIAEDDKTRWYEHWVEQGLEAVEQRLAGDARTGRFCHGDAPTLADCALVPQIVNAQRFKCRLDHVPTVMRVFDACMALDAFATTQPSAYPEPA